MAGHQAWPWLRDTLQAWRALADAPAVDAVEFRQRINFVERGVAIPVKGVLVVLLFYFLFVSRWFADVTVARAGAWEVIRGIFLGYVAINVGGAILLSGMHQVSVRLVERVVYGLALVDGVGLSALVAVTGGFDSMAYWVFFGLIIRNAAVIPHADVQIAVNLVVSALYVGGGILDLAIGRSELEEVLQTLGRARVQLAPAEGAAEPVESLVLRVLLLLLMTACCYGIQRLAERRRQEEVEAREFAVKQQQLQAAGRLAAEIAHQLKNPLSIINNVAYALQRAPRLDPDTARQLDIIREEVARSDGILTELMGYAQLAEGKVERVNVLDELEAALRQVFPPGSAFTTRIRREYAPVLPLLLGQRQHFTEIFANLLTNAREAMEGAGEITLTARAGEDYTVEVVCQDTGPGIPAELLDRLFEPYFTTKEKGTGLGLAIVRHNTELYGGRVEVRSEVGRGTAFHVTLPARTVMRFRP